MQDCQKYDIQKHATKSMNLFNLAALAYQRNIVHSFYLRIIIQFQYQNS